MLHRYCLALDLVDDPALIAAYEKWHGEVWPGIIRSIVSAGIEQMEIYRVGNRLFMIMEANDAFSFEAKAAADLSNPEVQAWEQLMWTFQQPLPFAKPGQKWMLMDKIFQLT